MLLPWVLQWAIPCRVQEKVHTDKQRPLQPRQDTQWIVKKSPRPLPVPQQGGGRWTNEHLPLANKTDPRLPEPEAAGAPWRNQRTFASGKQNRSSLAGVRGLRCAVA
jgi:hypothetical protein